MDESLYPPRMVPLVYIITLGLGDGGDLPFVQLDGVDLWSRGPRQQTSKTVFLIMRAALATTF